MMCMGDAVPKAQVVENPVEQIDICPTISRLFQLRNPDLPENPAGLWI